MKKEIKLKCIDDMSIFKPYGGMMRGEKFLGKFLEGEEYIGVLDIEKMSYMVKSHIGFYVSPVYIEDGWKMISLTTSEAIKLLEQGKKVRRASWEEKDNYIYLNEKGTLRHSNGNRYRLEHHINRADWEEHI